MRNLLKLRFLCTFLTLFLVLSLIVGGCGKKEKKEEAKSAGKQEVVKKAPEEKVIKIGAILPLTGNIGSLGEPERNALLLALEDVQNFGKKVLLQIEDSRGNSKDGISAMNKLLAQGVRFFIVSTTGVSRAIQPIASKNHVITFAQCMDPSITSESKYIFRIFPNYLQEQEALVKYMSKVKIKKVALYYANSAGIKPEADAFRKLASKAGLKIVYEGAFEIGQTNFRNELSKIKNIQMDALLILAYGNSYPPLMKQIREMKFNVPIFGNVALEQEKAVEMGTEIYEGVIFPSLTAIRSEFNRVEDFKKRYFRRFGRYPGGFLDYAYFYDAFRVIVRVAEESEGNPDKAVNLLLSLKFRGITGLIKFSPQGDASLSLRLVKYHNGKVVPLNF